eukprot:TRINITY_DN71278_c0_g1_i1.p1 TRINITY_DN71278_c0_g1~~TRINITY_DN71278_c0_g1_i1.p1  ORF type:complete len:170 (+),score=42.30 TRINITY_DN71278_c0_g1_i1:141-650(+)
MPEGRRIPAGRLPPVDDPKVSKLMEAFRELDKDGGGDISKEEFLSNLAASHTEEELERLLSIVDMDGDGKISYTEFIRMDMMISSFRRFDDDNSGQISGEELRLVLLKLNPSFTEAEFDSLFSTLDADHNGQLDYAEFIRFVCGFSDELGVKEKKAIDMLSKGKPVDLT